jgi:hypothetical protein
MACPKIQGQGSEKHPCMTILGLKKLLRILGSKALSLHTFCRSCDRSIARCAPTSRGRSSGWSFWGLTHERGAPVGLSAPAHALHTLFSRCPGGVSDSF